MSCAEARRLLDAWLDGELDLRGSLEVEDHLGRCAGCAAEGRALRDLQEHVRANLPRYAPRPQFEELLRSALRAGEAAASAPAVDRAPQVRAEQGRPEGARVGEARPRAGAAHPIWRGWRWLAPAAAAAALFAAVGPRLWRPPPEATLADAVIVAHVRSLLANHLTDIASSDQHTVKPWFQGKLDYSVTVTDWASEGYPLLGGRLDYVEDAPAAALVYRRAQHVVNLFVWPSRGSGDEPLQRLSKRGYNAFRWAKDGMRYWAVSDLNEAELRKFAELVRRGS